jgi:hypothetical protein
MTKSTTPCTFCGSIGSLSTEHVMPKWLRKAVLINGPVKEYSGTTYVGAAEAGRVDSCLVLMVCGIGLDERCGAQEFLGAGRGKLASVFSEQADDSLGRRA